MQDPTRQRLLEAAGEEFAAKGFEAARIRAICQRAGVNLAAVNYHFGDKESLYTEAVMEAHRSGRDFDDELISGEGTPAERLARFVSLMLRHIAALGEDGRWHQELMLREMIRPSAACAALVRQMIQPKFEALRAILEAARPGMPPRRLDALAFSVIGQCLHYRYGRPIAQLLIGPEAFAALDLEYLSRHITGVTLAALGLAPPLDADGRFATPA